MARSTVERGNTFRDLVASMLGAAGFASEAEVRAGFKKADVSWRREDVDGPVRYLVEAKDYSDTLGMPECREFRTDYGSLVSDGEADKAWLVSRGDISPDGRKLVDGDRNLKAMTFAEFQRRLIGVDGYLQDVVLASDGAGVDGWYVPPHTDNGRDLEEVVREWLLEADALPLAIVAGYGMGKSTFARHFAATLAREALADPTRRVPVLVPLGDIVDEQALEGLLGKVFTSRPGARGYNFGLFSKLNEAGRFVVVFDGFDEMKHGMTVSRFESEVVELMRLDHGQAKLVVLGRDTAFHDDVEFRSIIHGRQRTAGGSEVAALGRRPFRALGIREFTLEEARSFVGRFFPAKARDALRGAARPPGPSWVEERTRELLSGPFDSLLSRPVHAQMLCEIATDPEVVLADLSIHGLFDRFVHFLVSREVSKRGRDPRFSLAERRRFNAKLALWLWRQGGASTVSLAAVPASICREAAQGVAHDLGDEALRRELTAGCLVEKGRDTIYFGHRSLQEFLVAEALVAEDLGSTDGVPGLLDLLRLANPEVARFVVDAARSSASVASRASRWLEALVTIRRTDLPRTGFRMLVDLAGVPDVVAPEPDVDPWFSWMAYFVSNGGVDFAPRDDRALTTLSDLFRRGIAGTAENVAGVLLLVSQALMCPSPLRTRLGTAILASWLRPQVLQAALKVARERKRNELHYVSRDKDPAFWAFLKCADVTRAESEFAVVVTLPEVVKRMTQVLRIGLTPDPELDPGTRVDELRVPVQALYRAWNLRESELERTRPFFGDEALRGKIKPIEVEIIPPKATSPTAAQAVDTATDDRRGQAREVTAPRGGGPSPKRATGVVLRDLGRPARGDGR